MPGWHCITSRAEWEIGTGSSPSSWQRDWVGAAANELRGSVCRLGRGRSQTCPYRKRAYCDGWQRRGGIGWGLPRIHFVALCVSGGWGQVHVVAVEVGVRMRRLDQLRLAEM